MASVCKMMPKNWLRVLNSTPPHHPAGYIFLRYLSVAPPPVSGNDRRQPDRPGAPKGKDPKHNNITADLNNDQVRGSREGAARITSTTNSQRSAGEGGGVREAIADATRDTTQTGVAN